MKKTTLIFALSLAGLALGFAASRTMAPPTPYPAPTVTLKTFDGREVTLDEWQGKLRLVNFWATWCAPCRKEIPHLIDVQKRYGARGLQVIGPALDDPAAVGELADRLQINYPVMADERSVDAAMMLLGNDQGGLPYSVLIDPQGRIVRTVLGDMTLAEIEDLIAPHLPDSPK